MHLPWPPRLPSLRKRSEPRKTCHHGGTLPLANQLARADLKARLFGAPAESTRVGRYAVLRRLGAGGMGVVYVAYDEELGRKIALKLVHPGHHDPDASARSRREAQALARLSHPNVVQVYEVGEYQGQVYLAMEFVPGQTLRAWQAQAPRAWRDLVGMYLQAGRGLAAAHARGLVHRDFKPESGRFSFRTPSSRETPRISSLEWVGGKIGCPGLTLHVPD